MSNGIPILLTSSVVAHDKQVVMTDPEQRLQLAIESITKWLQIEPGAAIVLCDGSGFDFTTIAKGRFPGQKIECLQLCNDIEKVRLKGRGYGEGDIVRHAISHSALIAQAGCFAKCTSKLWVSNYQKYISQWNGNLLLTGVFQDAFSIRRKPRLLQIDTRFYVASVASYRNHFIDCHAGIEVENGHGLEECFRDSLAAGQLRGVLSNLYPTIDGTGGGSGLAYRNPPLRLLKERLRNAIVRQDPRFAHLFCRTANF